MSQIGNGPVSPYVTPVWASSTSEQLGEIQCIELDYLIDESGQHAIKAKAYDKAEERIDYPLLREWMPVTPPLIIPHDCPLPLWLAYSAVCQAVENFLSESSEFTLP